MSVAVVRDRREAEIVSQRRSALMLITVRRASWRTSAFELPKRMLSRISRRPFEVGGVLVGLNAEAAEADVFMKAAVLRTAISGRVSGRCRLPVAMSRMSSVLRTPLDMQQIDKGSQALKLFAILSADAVDNRLLGLQSVAGPVNRLLEGPNDGLEGLVCLGSVCRSSQGAVGSVLKAQNG